MGFKWQSADLKSEGRCQLTDSFLEGFFPSFGQQNLGAVYKCDGSIMVILVMCDVIQVDEVGFVGAEEIFAGEALFYIFQDTGQQVFFAVGCDYLGVPAMRNTAQDILHPQEFNSPGGLYCYFGIAHSTSI